MIILGEDNIVARLKTRDEGAIIEVIDRYKKKIIAFCYYYTLNYHDAEDLSQEVFISLYKGIENFREECSLSTYIYKIAVSRCMDYKRKKSIKNFLVGLFRYHMKVDCEFEENDHVWQSILSLSENNKVPILLYYYIGLNQIEIAEVLNISVKSVEGRIYRGKKKLKEQLEEGGFMSCSKIGTISMK